MQPASPVPFVRDRFDQHSYSELKQIHEGVAEDLAAPHGGAAAMERLRKGWTQENDKKFRENEELCRAIFGSQWDARYDRTRVRSLETGEMLSWGDGPAVYDREPPPPRSVAAPIAAASSAAATAVRSPVRVASASGMRLAGDLRLSVRAEQTEYGSVLREHPWFPPSQIHVDVASSHTQPNF